MSKCNTCVFARNLNGGYLNPSSVPIILGCYKKFLWFYVQKNPKKCNKYEKKGGLRL